MHGDDQPAQPQEGERQRRVDLALEPTEVLAEEAGHEREREEHRRDDRQLLDDLILL